MSTKDKKSAFDEHAPEYDRWFETNSAAYRSEVLAVEQAIPKGKKGIEIGVGTGRFAQPFDIKFGVEPSDNMARVAEQRGITVYRAYGEDLPIDDGSFDFALMVTTVCFLSDIPKAFSEVHRILKPQGAFIVAFIDKTGELGRKYESKKSQSKFYRDAHFHSTEEIVDFLRQSGFGNFQYWQTLTKLKGDEIEQPMEGYGEGSFVVIKAHKE